MIVYIFLKNNTSATPNISFCHILLLLLFFVQFPKNGLIYQIKRHCNSKFEPFLLKPKPSITMNVNANDGHQKEKGDHQEEV